MSHGEVTEMTTQIALEKQQAERDRWGVAGWNYLVVWELFYIFLCVSKFCFYFSAFFLLVFTRWFRNVAGFGGEGNPKKNTDQVRRGGFRVSHLGLFKNPRGFGFGWTYFIPCFFWVLCFSFFLWRKGLNNLLVESFRWIWFLGSRYPMKKCKDSSC